VTPLADEVRLVDGDERHRSRAADDLAERLGVGQLFRAEHDEVDIAGTQRVQGSDALRVMLRRVEHDRAEGAARDQGPELVALQRDERRHHHGEAAEKEPADLVDGALAAAGG
jgi:hypothetical protein